MLLLIEDLRRKKTAQKAVEQALKANLNALGKHNIGFAGGNWDLPMYSNGDGMLWAGFGGIMADAKIPRFWTPFGIYHARQRAQQISVEINIQTEGNSEQVSGFFAEDTETGNIFLMHTGKIGGGRVGIGRSAFLVSSKVKLLEVCNQAGKVRHGIAVAQLGHPNFVERLSSFVVSVQKFKDQAVAGALDTLEFKQKVEEFDRYLREASGKRQGWNGGAFEYIAYHGDIVQALYDERTARAVDGEKVFNSNLIDLYVKRDGRLIRGLRGQNRHWPSSALHRDWTAADPRRTSAWHRYSEDLGFAGRRSYGGRHRSGGESFGYQCPPISASKSRSWTGGRSRIEPTNGEPSYLLDESSGHRETTLTGRRPPALVPRTKRLLGEFFSAVLAEAGFAFRPKPASLANSERRLA